MDAPEFFAILGYPPRVAGRLPLLLRYIWGADSNIFAPSGYAIERWGPTAKYRPWLLLDARDLEPLERLINEGTDEDVLNFRVAQMANSSSTAVVGSLLASACATMLTLESLSQIHLVVRAIFTISLMLSMLSVYFTLVQQRELSQPTNTEMLRMWFWNGNTREPPRFHITGSPTHYLPGKMIRESSLTSYYVISAPFELLRIAICLFLGGVIAYLALVAKDNLKLGTGPSWGNRALVIAFVICTAFPLLMYGQALGQKDREVERCRMTERLERDRHPSEVPSLAHVLSRQAEKDVSTRSRGIVHPATN